MHPKTETPKFAATLTVVLAGLNQACAPQAVPESPTPKAAEQVTDAAESKAVAIQATRAEAMSYTWKSVSILGGGFVTGIVFSPIERNLVYARTDIGGAYRFNPTDKSWVPITDSIGRADSNFMGIESIQADPVDPNRVYMAVGTYTQDWAGKGAIFRSTNKGESWERTALTIKMGGNENGRSNGERLAVDPNQNSILFFGSRRDGLWKSSDSGQSFQKVESFPIKQDPKGLGIPFVLFDKKTGTASQPTRTLYAGVSAPNESLYRSIDGGATWKALVGQPQGLMPSHAAFDSKGTLYVTYGNVPGPSDVVTGAVFRFDPKTGRFSDITPQKPNENDKFGYAGLAVDALRPGTVLVTTIDRWGPGDEIYRTTDAGKRWTPLGPRAVRDAAGAKYLYWGRDKPSSTGWMGHIALDPFDSAHAMYVTGQGIWGSNDVTAVDSEKPTHFSFRSKNLEETVALSLISPPVGAPLLSGLGDICGFRHDDLDLAPARGMFENPIFGNVHGLDFAEKNAEMVVRVGTAQGASRGAFSSDGGISWTPFAAEPAASKGAGSVALSADGGTILWVPKGSPPAVSRDRGASWTTPSGAPAPGKLPEWANVSLRIASDRVNPSRFYVFDAQQGHVYVSRDAVARFERTAVGLPTLPDYAMSSASIQATPGLEGDVWLTTGKELYHSTDGGQSFAPVNVQESHAMGFGKAAPGEAYPTLFLIGKVEDAAGFFRSDDRGRSWARINDEAHQFGGGLNIVGDPRVHGRVYIGTHGRGILYGDPK